MPLVGGRPIAIGGKGKGTPLSLVGVHHIAIGGTAPHCHVVWWMAGKTINKIIVMILPAWLPAGLSGSLPARLLGCPAGVAPAGLDGRRLSCLRAWLPAGLPAWLPVGLPACAAAGLAA